MTNLLLTLFQVVVLVGMLITLWQMIRSRMHMQGTLANVEAARDKIVKLAAEADEFGMRMYLDGLNYAAQTCAQASAEYVQGDPALLPIDAHSKAVAVRDAGHRILARAATIKAARTAAQATQQQGATPNQE